MVNVAICSRDSEVNYKWLIDFLEKRMCKKTKINADPVHIANDLHKFRQSLGKYNFAILYHTRKRGRINITNVTDSLYDQELRCLHDKFKKKVIVVIDDLEKSDDGEKARILEGQRDLQTFAHKIFLFNEQEQIFTENKLKKIEDKEVQRKMKELKTCIKGKGSVKEMSCIS